MHARLNVYDFNSDFVKNVNFKVRLSPSKKIRFIYFNEIPLKMIKKYFLFHLKSSFRSQDIKILSQLLFHIKNLIRNIRLKRDSNTGVFLGIL